MAVIEQNKVQKSNDDVNKTETKSEDQTYASDVSDLDDAEMAGGDPPTTLTAEQQLHDAAQKKAAYNRSYYMAHTKKKRNQKKTQDESNNKCIEELKRLNSELLKKLHESEASKIATDRQLNAISVESQQYRHQLQQYQQQQYQKQQYHSVVGPTQVVGNPSYPSMHNMQTSRPTSVGAQTQSSVSRIQGVPTLPLSTNRASTSAIPTSGQHSRMGSQHVRDSVPARQQHISPIPQQHATEPVRTHRNQQYTTGSYMQNNRQYFAEQRR